MEKQQNERVLFIPMKTVVVNQKNARRVYLENVGIKKGTVQW